MCIIFSIFSILQWHVISLFQVYEETGFDISKLAREDEFIEGVLNYQYTRLYLIRNVPIGTVFVPRTRKEIKYCEWFSIEHLPVHKTDQVSKLNLGINANSFFMIMPFVKRLKKWINAQLDDTNGTENASTKKNNKMAGTHSPKPVFFKNNSTDRQRHKSLGDIEIQVITNTISSTQDNKNKIVNLLGQQVLANPSFQNKQPNYGQLKKANGINMNRLDDGSSSAENQSPTAQYKLNKYHPTNGQPTNKEATQFKSINRDGQKHRAESSSSQEHESMADINVLKKIRKKFSKVENQSSKYGSFNAAHTQTVVFNIPRFAKILQNEPNIRKWLNVELDKDNIFAESLKML